MQQNTIQVAVFDHLFLLAQHQDELGKDLSVVYHLEKWHLNINTYKTAAILTQYAQTVLAPVLRNAVGPHLREPFDVHHVKNV